MAHRCGDCRYFEPASQAAQAEQLVHARSDLYARERTGQAGECRRHAPTFAAAAASHGRWPIVGITDWCGEWKSRSNEGSDP